MTILSKHKFTLAFLLVGGQVFGQQELMLHQSPAHIWHRNTINPAIFPSEKRFAIGLPGLALDQQHSGDLSIQDFIREDGDQKYIDLGQVIGKLDPENTFDLDQRIETVLLGARFGKWAVHLGHAIRYSGSVTYPKSLAELLWYGNGPYIGQTLNIAPAFNIFGWNELGVGVSREIGKVRIGARAKYLAGIGAIESDADHHKATIYTNPDIYQLQLETDYAFRSAAFVNAIDTAGFGYDFQTEDLGNGKIFSKNSGLAFDLGFTAGIGERLTISGSLLDLGGKIKWTENASRFHSNGAWEYAGVEILGADLISGADSIRIDNQLDSLNDIFQFQKTAEGFSSAIPTRMYLGASFKVTERWTVGGVFFQQRGTARDLMSFGANAQFTPFKWLTAGAMYSINDRSAANIGLNLGLRLGPAHVYFTSDNVLNAFRGDASPALNLRAGAGVVF